jgi:pantothenate kinase
MPFEDFTKRPWKVRESDVPERCQVEEIVSITGTKENVKVECSEKHAYGPGEYFEQEPERIERKGEYTIKIVARQPRHRITATFSDLVGGSWTAEDNTPGPGDG